MIPRRLASVFTTLAKRHGDRYFGEGRVRIVDYDATRITATVEGAQSWIVRVNAGSERLVMVCVCPSGAARGYCAHLWATLLQIDAQGLLRTLLRPVGNLHHASFLTAADQEAVEQLARDDAELADAELDELDAVDDVDETPLPVPSPVPSPPPSPSRWRVVLETARQRAAFDSTAPQPAMWPADRRLVYIIDLPSAAQTPGLMIDLGTEKRNGDGTFDPAVAFRLGADVWLANPDPADRQIAQMLLGALSVASPWARTSIRTSGFIVAPEAFDSTLRAICETGRCRVRVRPDEKPIHAVGWDPGAAWTLGLRVAETASKNGYVVTGLLHRGNETMSLAEPRLLHSAGILVSSNSIARFDHGGAFSLVAELRNGGEVIAPAHELPALLEALFAYPRLPPLELPPEIGITERVTVPLPCLDIKSMNVPAGAYGSYLLQLGFDYGGIFIPSTTAARTVFDAQTTTLVRRDAVAERMAFARLAALGAREERDWTHGGRILALPSNRFETTVREPTLEGWLLDANGVAYRAMGDVRASVRSGIDWFDLEAVVTFGGREVGLPRLLQALRRGEQSIELDDGSRGIFSADWLRRLAPLAATGATKGEVTRFRRAQTGLLDALLLTLPAVDTDAAFETARTELRAFDRIAPADPPPSFVGTLRPYQSEGLGWLHFLRRFQLGGCLADDMGLGKTVQILALLEARRIEGAGPSLVVVPRSLVFNWRQEAERFTPQLRVVDHTGGQRRQSALDPASADLVITTYGTLRRDAVTLRDIEFDYVILDEAQAIKNPSTASAKAARLLRGEHRLALSGTPIENRIDELWSLIEFLNPGMLGASSTFSSLARQRGARAGQGEANAGDDHALLARALRPVILRRTKDQVARDLPDRSEQTLTVELEGSQRQLYDELLDHYRAELLPHIDRVGIGRAKLKILEALLRLRQAACHPGLVDSARAGDASAKLDVLMPKLAEGAAEGHKTLVFSQFTSFLALLRARLDADGVVYEYLDGQTRDRQARVEHFQNDADCRLFLISLKAGGHGLNLTAADYVFLLDPWWNPAVEAQAIDRAHRIGQKRHVIATRLVARDTIEEKILELQQSKRELADAILGADQGLIATIGREELAALLG